jgi:hypothetical protein
MHLNGIGCEQNFVEANRWLSLSASSPSGYEEAILKLPRSIIAQFRQAPGSVPSLFEVVCRTIHAMTTPLFYSTPISEYHYQGAYADFLHHIWNVCAYCRHDKVITFYSSQSFDCFKSVKPDVRCTSCLLLSYCSEQCRHLHWISQHKEECYALLDVTAPTNKK